MDPLFSDATERTVAAMRAWLDTATWGDVKTLTAVDVEMILDLIGRFQSERNGHLAEIDRLKEELADQEASFGLRHRADMRGISLWRDAHPGNDLVQPDHADLVCWLIAVNAFLRALVPAPKWNGEANTARPPTDPGLPPEFVDDVSGPAMPRW